MKNSDFKIILKEWKNFLKESNKDVGINNIYKQIENLKKINQKNGLNFRIKIDKESPNKYVIGYANNNSSHYSLANLYKNSLEKKDPSLAPILYGCIEIIDAKTMLKSDYDDTEIEVPSKGEGETNSTWFIRKTHDTKKGMGPLLYEVVIEFVSNTLNAGIKPDPYIVTDAAISVWKKYMDRSDIITKQLDITPIDISFYKKQYPDQYEDEGVKQLKPLTVQTSDDTAQSSAMDHMGFYWPDSPLSKTYRKNSEEIIKFLEEHNPPLIEINI